MGRSVAWDELSLGTNVAFWNLGRIVAWDESSLGTNRRLGRIVALRLITCSGGAGLIGWRPLLLSVVVHLEENFRQFQNAKVLLDFSDYFFIFTVPVSNINELKNSLTD